MSAQAGEDNGLEHNRMINAVQKVLPLLHWAWEVAPIPAGEDPGDRGTLRENQFDNVSVAVIGEQCVEVGEETPGIRRVEVVQKAVDENEVEAVPRSGGEGGDVSDQEISPVAPKWCVLIPGPQPTSNTRRTRLKSLCARIGANFSSAYGACQSR